jgi:hypothetical protein
MQARPTVLPIFLLGMSNHLVSQVRSNFNRTGKKIIVCFGEPMDLERYYGMPPRLRTYMALANHVRDVLTDLGTRERALRSRLEGGAGVRPGGDGDSEAA